MKSSTITKIVFKYKHNQRNENTNKTSNFNLYFQFNS